MMERAEQHCIADAEGLDMIFSVTRLWSRIWIQKFGEKCFA
jgi:hypothetical protein